MGASDTAEKVESQNSRDERKPVKIAVIMLFFGLFAPLFIIYQQSGFSWYLSFQSFMWTFTLSSSMYGPEFMVLPPFVLLVMFPIVILRLVPVSQIYRYYQGKTTRRRTLIALFIGDGFFLFYALIPFIMLPMWMFMVAIPIPAQIIFGALMLWRSPFQEPRTPWDSVLEEKSWWEKDETPPQTNVKDEDELW